LEDRQQHEIVSKERQRAATGSSKHNNMAEPSIDSSAPFSLVVL
jgi:hypothetical protein